MYITGSFENDMKLAMVNSLFSDTSSRDISPSPRMSSRIGNELMRVVDARMAEQKAAGGLSLSFLAQAQKVIRYVANDPEFINNPARYMRDWNARITCIRGPGGGLIEAHAMTAEYVQRFLRERARP